MKTSIKQALPFILLACLCAVVLSSAHQLTRERVSDNMEMQKLKILGAVMSADFDNDIYNDLKVLNYTDDSGNELTTHVYRARKSGEPVGVIFMPVLAKGYNGAIRLSVGILEGGIIHGVQVLTHQETEGLGGNIHQDKTRWLDNFANQSFDITPVEAWTIKSESGAFDHISGATITSHGVINAIKNSLELYLVEGESLYP